MESLALSTDSKNDLAPSRQDEPPPLHNNRNTHPGLPRRGHFFAAQSAKSVARYDSMRELRRGVVACVIPLTMLLLPGLLLPEFFYLSREEYKRFTTADKQGVIWVFDHIVDYLKFLPPPAPFAAAFFLWLWYGLYAFAAMAVVFGWEDGDRKPKALTYMRSALEWTRGLQTRMRPRRR